MATTTKRTTGRRDLDVAVTGRRLGFLALGTLLGGVSTVGTSTGAGTPSTEATTTATSSLALAQPAATFTVTTQADVVDPGDGQLSLREAVGKANATAGADRIAFAPVLEGQTLMLTRGELVVSNDLAIDGDRNDDGIEVTISGGNASRVLNIAGDSTDVSLRDLTVTEGFAFYQRGGAILLGGGSLAVINATVSDSATTNDLGGGYSDGGGIYAGNNSRVSILDSAILNNRVRGYGDGGDIATGSGVALTVRNSLFAGNSAGAYQGGGAIHTDPYGSLVMEGTTLRGNLGDQGGALGLQGGTATIARSTITGNTAAQGGGINASDSRLILTDSTLEGNIAEGGVHFFPRGGGISSGGGELIVRNSTITGNAASDEYGPVDAAAVAGGVYISSFLPATLDIANSIVAGNAVTGAAGSRDPNIFGTITASNGHNIFGTDVAGDIAGDRERPLCRHRPGHGRRQAQCPRRGAAQK